MNTAELQHSPVRLLVRSVNWLGDAVMTTPALLRIRQAHPDWRISLLTPQSLAPLWQGHPAIDEVIPFPNRRLFSTARLARNAGPFQIGLVFPNSIRSSLELWLAGVPQRIGYASGIVRRALLTSVVPRPPTSVPMHKRSVREIHRLLDAPVRPDSLPPQTHHLFHYLHLAGQLGARTEPIAPRIEIAPAELNAFRTRAEVAGTDWFLGLNPGAEYGPAKRWPAERFVSTAVAVHRETGCRWLVFGGPGDRSLGSEIAEAINSATRTHNESRSSDDSPRAVNLAGQTSLRELCVALKCCRVVLTNDTGPMHLAAAVGTPVVVPFGSTSPELTGPGWPGDAAHQVLRSPVPCSPCFRRTCPIDFRCMMGITVEQAAEAVLIALRTRNQSRGSKETD